MSRLIVFIVSLIAPVVWAADVPVAPTPAPTEQTLQQLAQQTKDLFTPPVAITNRPAWQNSITFGLTMSRGNHDTVLATGKLLSQWKSATNEFSLGLDGAYGDDNSVKNYETLHGFGQANHFFTQHFFGFGRVDGLHDGIKDIDYRFTVSPGAGYYLLRQTNMTLATEAGPSVITERQGSADETYAAFRVAERLEYKLNPTTRLWQGAEFIPEVDKPDNFIVNAELGIETSITKQFGLQVYLQDNFVNQPVAGFKNNDVRLVSGLSYKF